MLLKERIREYAFSKLQYALTSRTIDIPSKETPSVFGNGIVMHYVSHVPDAKGPLSFHWNHNKGARHQPRTPAQLDMGSGRTPTKQELDTAVNGNRAVNEILGHYDDGMAVSFFSDKSSAERLAGMTGGVARSVVMDANKVGHHMRSVGDYRNRPNYRGWLGVYNHPELGDYYRPYYHRSLIDHAQTASLNTTGAGEIHELVQQDPNSHLHRMALADHLEEQGKHGLADKVRQSVPVHYRRKYAIIRFCRQRLRFAMSSKYGMELISGDPVEKLNTDGSRKAAGTYMGPGSLDSSGNRLAHVQLPSASSLGGGSTAEYNPAYLGHISPSELRSSMPPPSTSGQTSASAAKKPIQEGDYVHAHLPNGQRLSETVYRVTSKDSMDPGETLIQELNGGNPFNHDSRWLSHASQEAIDTQHRRDAALMAQQPAYKVPPIKIPARKAVSGKSPLNAAVLPSADIASHAFHDPIEARQGASAKLEAILGQERAGRVRARFADWAGKPIDDSHIADMMCVPRPSHLANNNHPVLFTKLSGSVDRTNRTVVPGQDSTHSIMTVESDDPNYEYYHDNKLKVDENGDPYLYFNIVRHGGDNSGGDKAISMPHVLWNAAVAANKNGVKKIKLHAALGGDWVGGVYWPKMGFDHNLYEAYGSDTRKWNSIVNAMQKRPHLFGGIEGKNPLQYTLLDMLHHAPTYNKYFQKDPNGDQYDTASQFPHARNLRNAYFDTDPNSRSMKILAAYLRKIEGGPSSQQTQQGAKQ
jgi:hypothetical protein